MATGKQHQKKAALALAVKTAGGQNGLARALGRRQSTVWDWTKDPSKVSAEDAIAIEKVTGVPAEQINSALAEFAHMRGIEERPR